MGKVKIKSQDIANIPFLIKKQYPLYKHFVTNKSRNFFKNFFWSIFYSTVVPDGSVGEVISSSFLMFYRIVAIENCYHQFHGPYSLGQLRRTSPFGNNLPPFIMAGCYQKDLWLTTPLSSRPGRHLRPSGCCFFRFCQKPPHRQPHYFISFL